MTTTKSRIVRSLKQLVSAAFFMSCLIGTKSVAGFITLPNKEEIIEWCGIKSEPQKEDFSELSDEEMEQQEVLYGSCILILQAFIKGVESSSDGEWITLCPETASGFDDFILNDTEGLESFEEVAWQYFYGRCQQ